jgi:hypothetical protein
MSRKGHPGTVGWPLVQDNPTYRKGALDHDEGLGIRWHSPSSEHSSQVFCVSAFGHLRRLPDCDQVLQSLFADLPTAGTPGRSWNLALEHTDAGLLGETGCGTPTSVDVFCQCADMAVCIESKFLVDADEGFGGCGQAKTGACAGHYGPGSDKRTKTDASCRLTVAEGKRDARRYWQLGRSYFRGSVFLDQAAGQDCPFRGPSFQLMRNFLFAAKAAGSSQNFGVLCIVPEQKAAKCRKQVDAFKASVLLPRYGSFISLTTYDILVAALGRSKHPESQRLGRFISERMRTLL